MIQARQKFVKMADALFRGNTDWHSNIKTTTFLNIVKGYSYERKLQEDGYRERGSSQGKEMLQKGEKNMEPEIT